MLITDQAASGRRLTGWGGVFGALLGWATLVFVVLATGGDLQMTYRPADFLAQPAERHQLFVIAMLLDVLGFYVPLLLMAGYFWSRLRQAQGALMDIAALCAVAYAVLGLVGAGLLIATLEPLAKAWALAEPVARPGVEAAWLAISYAAQQGVWLLEGPVMGLWGVLVGRALRVSGLPYGRLLMALGLGYAGFFAASALGLAMLVEVLQLLVVALLPLWMLLSGIHLLREA